MTSVGAKEEQSPHTDVGAEALSLADQINSGRVGLGRSAGRATTALLGDIAVGASLDIVIGDVAAILSLIPDAVAVHRGAGGLAADGNIGALAVGLLYSVAGARARAAVNGAASDGVGDGRSGESGEDEELHFDG